MADGKNEARALRILEIMNDFRTLQAHIRSHINAASTSMPAAQYQTTQGYALFRQLNAESQSILATQYNPGNLGIQPGNMPATEQQKAALQRIILDASARRWRAHKIYLQVAACRRWQHHRAQVLGGQPPSAQNAAPLAAVDQRLRSEVTQVTDEHVYRDLRNADNRKNYWIEEDPNLSRIVAWSRSNS